MVVSPKRVAQGCLKQFKWTNCGLDHQSAHRFVKSQWQSRTRSIWYLIYRWVLAAYFLASVSISMAKASVNYTLGYYFIYLTNWGIVLCAVTCVYGALLITTWYFHPKFSYQLDKIDEMPRSFKLFWILHGTALVLSITITVMYWGLLYNDTMEIDAVNIMTHATNSVAMFLDMLIVSHPLRLLHVIQPIVFGLVYSIFSVIYYLAGGVNVKEEPFIYNVLDWSKPGGAMITVVMTLALALVIQIFLLIVYYIRTAIYMSCCYKEDFVATTSRPKTNEISMVFGRENQLFDMSSEKDLA